MRPLALTRALLLALAAAAPAAQADDVTSKAPDKVAVTIYRPRPVTTWRLVHPGDGAQAGGLALITETRTLVLPAGPAVIRFEGVSDQVVPQTAEAEGLPAPAEERNFDYDLLTPGSLIAKSLGQTVELVDTNPKTGKAKVRKAVLRSGPDGVMLDVDGKVEAFKCDRGPQRLVFERIPAGLSDKPTLSLKTEVPRAGRYKVRLSYLATGFNWSADYVAKLRPDGRTLDLEGWITLANSTGESFHDAPTQVVAGRLSLTGEDQPVEVAPVSVEEDCWERDPAWFSRRWEKRGLLRTPVPPAPAPMAMNTTVREVVVTGSRAKMAMQEDLGDYKLYTLPEPATVAAKEAKQVLFLSQAAVPYRKVFRYAVVPHLSQSRPTAAQIVLKLDNSKAGGLGLPLPAGTVSVREAQGALYAGETRIGDIPKGEPVKLRLGQAPTVGVVQRVTNVTLLDRKTHRERIDYEVTVVNARGVPAVVEIAHPQEYGLAVTASSLPHGTDAGDVLWTITAQPGGREILRYTVETGG